MPVSDEDRKHLVRMAIDRANYGFAGGPNPRQDGRAWTNEEIDVYDKAYNDEMHRLRPGYTYKVCNRAQRRTAH